MAFFLKAGWLIFCFRVIPTKSLLKSLWHNDLRVHKSFVYVKALNVKEQLTLIGWNNKTASLII